MKTHQAAPKRQTLWLPLSIENGAFRSAKESDALLRFAKSFFAEWRGSVPDDPGFGGRDHYFIRLNSVRGPLEQVLAEFRRRYGRLYTISHVPERKADDKRGAERRAPYLEISLRSDRRAKITIDR